MASRRDVAEAANVSVRTVSNVVNGFSRVAPDTRQRVLEAIERLGYHPSEMARGLKLGRSGQVALMLPELDTAYFAELTRAFVEGGDRRGLSVVVNQTNGALEHELALLKRSAGTSMFDALVLSPLALKPHHLANFPAAPTVFLGEDDFPGFDKVMIDNCSAARQGVEHLVQSGRSHIAAIGAERTSHGSSALRLEGFRSAVQAAGLPVMADAIEYVEGFTRVEGYAATQRLLERGELPDALFCFSDALAFGALRALHDAGLKVPEDIAIMGWDNIQECSFSIPSLSSVSPDKRAIAELALDRVQARLDDPDLPPTTVIAPHQIVERESSAPRP